jgi:hypothetical protein
LQRREAIIPAAVEVALTGLSLKIDPCPNLNR